MTIRQTFLALFLVFAGWLATLSAVMVFSNAAPGAIVFFPHKDFVARLPDEAAVTGGGAIWVAVKSDMQNLGPALYRVGGRLVLPAGLPGCLPLPSG